MKNLAIAARRALPAHVLGVMLGLVSLVACGGGGGGNGSPVATTATGTGAAAQAASVQVRLEVPDALASEPLQTERTLMVPAGFGIRVWARVTKARFLARAPNGDVLVSVPSEGKIVLLRDRANDTPERIDFATDLHNPHDMVFHSIGSVTYLYVAESDKISRSVYQNGETARGAAETVVDGLPDASTPELQGSYGHELKNIALTPDNKLFVSIASTCNACVEDTESEPVRGAVYQYDADGSNGRIYARGLRNAEGLDILPGTNALWVTVNNRDQIPFPLDADFDGDGNSDFGEVLPSYVNNNPPELFTSVRDGGNYGWPFCNSVANAAMADLDLVRDAELNPDGSRLDCAGVDRSRKGLQAHGAPLGFSFLHNSNVPAAYRSGAVIAEHGCWNCTSLIAGYKLSYVPFDAAGNPGAAMDFVTGFVTDPDARQFWGRPVDAIPDGKGNLLISDDYANAIYLLYPT